MGERKYRRDILPCTCGSGTLVVEVSIFGVWRVEGLVQRCSSCASGNFTAARERQLTASASSESRVESD